MNSSEYIKQAITKNIKGASVIVHTNDQVHFELEVSAAAFADQSMLTQHRMVYNALGKDWADKIHAIALTTKVVKQEENQDE